MLTGAAGLVGALTAVTFSGAGSTMGQFTYHKLPETIDVGCDSKFFTCICTDTLPQVILQLRGSSET